MGGIFLESSRALKMPKKGKILSLSGATWFLTLCGLCWDQGGCPTPVPALLHRHMGSASFGVGQIQDTVSQGDGENGEWEFVPDRKSVV